jgi:hypothetical protein
VKGRAALEFGTIVVVGGGCHGSHYVRQLQRAQGREGQRSHASWSWTAAHARNAIVPSPLMPHLLYAWLATQARAVAGNADLRGEAPGDIPGVPWQNVGADGTRYVSFATWICPINCIEPARCPHTRGPRDWSLHRPVAAPFPHLRDFRHDARPAAARIT